METGAAIANVVNGQAKLPRPYYQDSAVTIFHGDCRRSSLALSCDLVLSDPPYGGGLAVDFADRFKAQAGKWWKNTDRSYQKRHIEVAGDSEPFDPAFVLSIESRAKVLWGANWYANRLPDSGGWWIWDKRNGKRDVSEAEWPMSEAELAWTNIGKGVRMFRHTWFGLIRDSENGEHYHPTQKPVALMQWCIETARCPTGAIIVDPYMGSGPVLRAAKNLGMRAIGFEIEEKYCEIAAKRMEQEVMDFGASAICPPPVAEQTPRLFPDN
jgi:site-specific DNA-methyltransferase (adenine-specific)